MSDPDNGFLTGRTKDFREAFPKLFIFELRVEEVDILGRDGEYKVYEFNMNYPPPPQIHCSNPLCHRGGLDIDDVLGRICFEELKEVDDKRKCPGDEGSPKGRKRGKFCHHGFRITGTFNYGYDKA